MGKPQLSEMMEKISYEKLVVSGQTIVEVSGAIKLHSIVVGRKTSGQICTIFDSAISGRFLSGGVSVIGLIHGGDALNVPVEVKYDVGLNSGLVVLCSGAVWNLTCMYK